MLTHKIIKYTKKIAGIQLRFSSMKVKLKRLVNHRKGVSKRKLGNKFNKHHMTIGHQIKKLGIEDYASEKTPKYTEEQAVKAKKTEP